MTKQKLSAFIWLYILSSTFSIIYAQSEDDLPELLTPEKAETIIKERRASKEAAEQERLEAALGKEAIEERVLNRDDGQQIVFRRVAPAAKIILNAAPESAETPSPLDHFAAADMDEILHESIHIGANVYGDAYSEIQWRDPEAGLNIKVWSNIRLDYLRPISAFEIDGVQYSYFGFTTHYSEEAEQQRRAMAAENGFSVESLWKTPPVVFSDDYYEYYVDVPWDMEVPDKLYRQLDALFSFYLSNFSRLEIEHINAKMLQSAKDKDLTENPPVKPKQVIMNYTPLRGEAAE